MTDALPADIALAVRAQSGDREAAGELAALTRRAVTALAVKLAGRYGPTVTPRDLIDVAMARFPLYLRHYQPARGSFVNYARVSARRAMREYARRELARVLPSLPADPSASPAMPDAEAAYAALSRLPPAERLIFAACAHVGNRPGSGYRKGEPTRKPCTPERLADLCGTAPAAVTAIVDAAAAKLRRALAGGKRPGRPPYSAPLVRHIRGLRAKRATWKQVASEVNRLYGVRLTVNAIQVLHHRHKSLTKPIS